MEPFQSGSSLSTPVHLTGLSLVRPPSLSWEDNCLPGLPPGLSAERPALSREWASGPMIGVQRLPLVLVARVRFERTTFRL